MSSNRSPSFPLIADTVRSHRRGIVVWILGGTAAMYAIAAGFASEVARYEGGARAMAASVEAGADALRLLRWPAERLDTVGGYLTYHNITLFMLFLALYAGAQGVGAIRGAEPRHTVDAHRRHRPFTHGRRPRPHHRVRHHPRADLGRLRRRAGPVHGRRRANPTSPGRSSPRARAARAPSSPTDSDSLVSQIAGTLAGANGVTALILTVLYLLTNVSDQIGPLGVVRFVSPFHYFNQSRALVPGHGFSIAAFLIVAGHGGRARRRRGLGVPAA